jgi:hypothetical protein
VGNFSSYELLVGSLEVLDGEAHRLIRGYDCIMSLKVAVVSISGVESVRRQQTWPGWTEVIFRSRTLLDEVVL